MENASKALFIAAGVFMAITLLVIGVNLYVKYRDVAQTYQDVMNIQEIAKINKEFEKYNGRNDITIQEIIAALQTANGINQKYKFIDSKKIWVTINSDKVWMQGTTEKNKEYQERLINLIKNNIDNKYTGEIVGYDPDTEMITLLNFTN